MSTVRDPVIVFDRFPCDSDLSNANIPVSYKSRQRSFTSLRADPIPRGFSSLHELLADIQSGKVNAARPRRSSEGMSVDPSEDRRLQRLEMLGFTPISHVPVSPRRPGDSHPPSTRRVRCQPADAAGLRRLSADHPLKSPSGSDSRRFGASSTGFQRTAEGHAESLTIRALQGHTLGCLAPPLRAAVLDNLVGFRQLAIDDRSVTELRQVQDAIKRFIPSETYPDEEQRIDACISEILDVDGQHSAQLSAMEERKQIELGQVSSDDRAAEIEGRYISERSQLIGGYNAIVERLFRGLASLAGEFCHAELQDRLAQVSLVAVQPGMAQTEM
jgi:hypothetical protein